MADTQKARTWESMVLVVSEERLARIRENAEALGLDNIVAAIENRKMSDLRQGLNAFFGKPPATLETNFEELKAAYRVLTSDTLYLLERTVS